MTTPNKNFVSSASHSITGSTGSLTGSPGVGKIASKTKLNGNKQNSPSLPVLVSKELDKIPGKTKHINNLKKASEQTKTQIPIPSDEINSPQKEEKQDMK